MGSDSELMKGLFVKQRSTEAVRTNTDSADFPLGGIRARSMATCAGGLGRWAWICGRGQRERDMGVCVCARKEAAICCLTLVRGKAARAGGR